jgi:hypothetical protein
MEWCYAIVVGLGVELGGGQDEFQDSDKFIETGKLT